MRDRARRTLARLAVGGLLLTTAIVARVGRAMRGRRPGSTGRHKRTGKLRLLVVGTFYNPNWIRAHLLPLARAANVARVTVVCGSAGLAHPHLVYDVPPAWLCRLCGRALAKVLWFFVVARRCRPHVAVGYHIMPNGLLCLAASGLFGCQCIYQMTGGPVQFAGGGFGSENPLLHMQGRPNATLERWMFGIGRLMDVVVVRGKSAQCFLRRNGIARRPAIITGSVDTDRFAPGQDRRLYDIAYVARLVPNKGVEAFIEIVHELSRRRPGIRAAMVGDGVLRDALQRRVLELGIEANVSFLGRTDDVPGALAQSRLFMLVSPTEGMAIAMLEALAAALPVVVTDVGDLRDALQDTGAGILLPDACPQRAAAVVLDLLNDPARLSTMGSAGRRAAVDRYSLQAVTRQWETLLDAAREHV